MKELSANIKKWNQTPFTEFKRYENREMDHSDTEPVFPRNEK